MSILTRWSRLCRGIPTDLLPLVMGSGGGFRFWVLTLWGCGAIYGSTLGIGRGPLQGLYTAIKFPLLILLVLWGNAVLNTLIASLLGVPMRFREVVRAMCLCFSLFALILGSLAPVFLFLTFNLPSLEGTGGLQAYRGVVLFHVAAIALAGCASHLRLFRLISLMAGDRNPARWVLLAWLAGNLLLGAQLSWNLRPFFGSPVLEVAFIRPEAFERNFFEALYAILRSFLTHNPQEIQP